MAQDIPQAEFVHIGGSGSWGFRYPEQVFDANSELSAHRLGGPLRFDTPFGESPPFGLYELRNEKTGLARKFLHVWFHGLQPTMSKSKRVGRAVEVRTAMEASEKVFSVLRRAGTKWVLVDASVGGINPLLDSWDPVIAHDYYDDMKRIARSEIPGTYLLRRPYCPYLREKLIESAGRNLARYSEIAERVTAKKLFPKIVRRGVSVSEDGWWFGSATHIYDYARRGFDIVGKTVVPEVQLARSIGAHFACLNPVTNPAEGRIDPDTGTESLGISRVSIGCTTGADPPFQLSYSRQWPVSKSQKRRARATSLGGKATPWHWSVGTTVNTVSDDRRNKGVAGS